MHNVATRSMGHAKECAYMVPFTLQHPVGIFEGLKEDADEDPRGLGWYCYCSTPSYSYDENGKQIPPFPGRVFLVFVNRDKVAYNWYYDRVDASDQRFPERFETRFQRRAL
jgi:hypothetical protein